MPLILIISTLMTRALFLKTSTSSGITLSIANVISLATIGRVLRTKQSSWLIAYVLPMMSCGLNPTGRRGMTRCYLGRKMAKSIFWRDGGQMKFPCARRSR